MYLETVNGKMYYQKIGSGPSIIFLHGWGQSGKTFNDIVDNLKDQYTLYIVDFLGFGKSDDPNSYLKCKDYCNHIIELIVKENINEPVVIGHSFGGRIAIYLSSKGYSKKTILVNSAGINHHDLKYYLRLIKYKIVKSIIFIFNKKRYKEYVKKHSSRDYRVLNEVMRGTFRNVVGEDLKQKLRKIKNKTLIIASSLDKEVSVNKGKMMKKLIKDSELVIFYRAGHFSYLDEKDNFLRVVKRFISE